MDLDYRRQQAQHYRHALEKLHKQWQQCFAESSCSDFDSGQLPVVSTRTYDPAGTLPLPALDTFLSPSNENEIHEEARVMSASSAASPPYVRTPFPTEAHPDPYSSFGLNALSSPLDHFALFEHYNQVNNGGYASLAEIQQLNHQTVDVVDATSMWSACQPAPSHSNGYNHNIEGRANERARTSHSLSIWQQPERARLCSYKEENETIDRRPVDPPPVIEVLLADRANGSQYFVRASIVHPEPKSIDEIPTYKEVKTATGADASAGEIVQTPERWRGMDGRAGQLCVFAKLSVRMPGVFCLKFTLYRNDERGIAEIAHTISDTFEVCSPKMFKGMKESTALTRHLAAQGLKVKLRNVASSKQ